MGEGRRLSLQGDCTDISTRGRAVEGPHLPALDGLRGVAIGLVLAAHLGLDHVVPGAFGVTLFFFISGWLITGLLLREQGQTGGIALGRFYLRRALRLLPAAFAYIVIAGSAFIAGGGHIPPAAWAASLLYGANYASFWGLLHSDLPGVRHPFSILWSLAIEEQFYALWPLALAAILRRRALVWIGALCLASLAWRVVLYHHCPFLPGSAAEGSLLDAACLPVSPNPLWRFNRLYLATDTRLDSLGLGAALALAQRAGWRRAWPMAGLGLLGLSFALPGDWARFVLRPSLQGAGLFLLFPALLGGWPGRCLSSGPMVALGRLSYALYLWHWAALMLADLAFAARPLAHAAVALALALLLASLSYGGIERPMLRLRRKAGSTAPLGLFR